jgi:hypothetical protein
MEKQEVSYKELLLVDVKEVEDSVVSGEVLTKVL